MHGKLYIARVEVAMVGVAIVEKSPPVSDKCLGSNVQTPTPAVA